MTGAGNGIGRAITPALVAEGVRTVFTDIRQEALAGFDFLGIDLRLLGRVASLS